MGRFMSPFWLKTVLWQRPDFFALFCIAMSAARKAGLSARSNKRPRHSTWRTREADALRGEGPEASEVRVQVPTASGSSTSQPPAPRSVTPPDQRGRALQVGGGGHHHHAALLRPGHPTRPAVPTAGGGGVGTGPSRVVVLLGGGADVRGFSGVGRGRLPEGAGGLVGKPPPGGPVTPRCPYAGGGARAATGSSPALPRSYAACVARQPAASSARTSAGIGPSASADDD